MEHQAKERLTGAVLLVVLLVLLVPELLTGPHRAPPPTPAQPDQAPMRSYTIDLGDSPHANNAPVAASTAVVTPASEPAPTVHAASEPVPVPRDAAATVASAPAAESTSQAPAEEHAAVEVPAAVAPQAAEPTVSHTESHAADAETEHSPAAWTVQLGLFSNRLNAVHLVANMKSQGFSATISEITKKGHKLFRVRVGAEKDRAGAQKLLNRLKAAGVKGAEIAPR